MVAQESNTELAALSSIEAFPLLSETDEVLELVRTNLGEDERLTFEDLDVLHAPGGAATQWALPTAEGERQVEHIDGVIILHKKANTYWAKSYEETGGGTSPDCYSVDGKTGIGDPGGACAVCPMSRFTGDPPRKPCREVKNLLIAEHDRLMPLVIRVSPGSLKPVGTYFRRLINDRRRHHEVVTRFSLNVARNGRGLQYSAISCRMLMPLPSDVVEKVAAIKEHFEQLFAARPQDVSENGNGATPF